MTEKERVERALWAVNQDEFSYDYAVSQADPGTPEGRSHVAALKWVGEMADATIAALAEEVLERIDEIVRPLEPAFDAFEALGVNDTKEG